MSIATENDLIDRLAECIRFLGCGSSGPRELKTDPSHEFGFTITDDDTQPRSDEYDEQLQYGYGHSGEGWYLSCGQYPDEGAEFIAPDEYGALVVAQALVAAERAAVDGDPEPGELTAPVSFVAQLMALGSADVLAEDLAAHGSTSVLIFAAEVEEVRKAAPLFRRPVRLTEGAVSPLLSDDGRGGRSLGGSPPASSAHTPRPEGARVGDPEQASGNTYSDRGGA